MKTEEQKSSKKPYHSPELLVYGGINEITRVIGTNGAIDGGGSGTNSTQL